MTELEKLAKEMDERAAAIAKAHEDIVEMGLDINTANLSGLIKLLTESIDAQVKKETQYFDPKLAESLKESIASVVRAFAEHKEQGLKFEPNINLNIEPVMAIANEIAKSNQSILTMITRMEETSKGEERFNALLTICMDMIKKNNEFLKKGIKQIDNSEQLVGIASAISNRSVVQKLTLVRGEYDLIKEIIPVYKESVTVQK